MSVFSDNLKARTQSMGLTQVEIARRLNLDPRRVGHYMTGLREPDLATLARLARALDTSVDALIGARGAVEVREEFPRLRAQIATLCLNLDQQQLEILLAVAKAILAQQRVAAAKKPGQLCTVRSARKVKEGMK